jgi:hypothetical protein
VSSDCSAMRVGATSGAFVIDVSLDIACKVPSDGVNLGYPRSWIPKEGRVGRNLILVDLASGGRRRKGCVETGDSLY